MNPKLVVATSFPVWPPRGGGQVRVAGLYAALGRLGVDIDIVALVPRGDHGGIRRIAPGLRELRVPRTPRHDHAEYRLHVRAGVPVTDLALALHHELTPGYGEALAAASAGAVAVVACHPFAQPAIEASTDLPLIYEAQDVETDLKQSMLAGSDAPEELTQVVRDVEGACCAAAAHTIVCAAEDGARLGELFGLPAERVVVVPNGVDPTSIPYTSLEQRAERKTALGLRETFQALFLGSWHEPNLVAVRDVLVAAEVVPDARFLIVGSAGVAFAGEKLPPNVDLCGVVDTGFVHSILGLADAALNPMRWGSGTNLKMLDYALSGVPMLSTEFGARGLGLGAGVHYAVVEPQVEPSAIAARSPLALADALAALRAESGDAVACRTLAARDRVADGFSWDAIAARWREHPALGDLLEGAVPAR